MNAIYTFPTESYLLYFGERNFRLDFFNIFIFYVLQSFSGFGEYCSLEISSHLFQISFQKLFPMWYGCGPVISKINGIGFNGIGVERWPDQKPDKFLLTVAQLSPY